MPVWTVVPPQHSGSGSLDQVCPVSGFFSKGCSASSCVSGYHPCATIEVGHGHSSFTSSGKGSEVRGRFLYSLLFLKPWLQKQQKNPFHSCFFFLDCSIVFVYIRNLPSLYRKKNLQWKREYLKNEKNPHTALGEITKSFPSWIVAERCTCKVHLDLHGWLCLVKQGHVRGRILAVVKPVGFLPVILIRARISP